METFRISTNFQKNRPLMRLTPRATLRGGFIEVYRLKFCINETKENGKKERFFQNNVVHNINIRQLLSDTNKKTIIVPNEEESLEVVETFNRS